MCVRGLVGVCAYVGTCVGGCVSVGACVCVFACVARVGGCVSGACVCM